MQTDPKEEHVAAASGEEKGSYRIGDEINWQSDLVPVRLSVELPFWLLTPNGSLALTVEGCTLPATITNDGVEIQFGHEFSRAHRGVVYLGPRQGAGVTLVPVGTLTGGGVFRRTRTIVTLETAALSDAIVGFREEGRRNQDSARYFASLARAHLPFVNHLINSYRRISVDPYVTEVSEWDVPVWFVSDNVIEFPACVFPYNAEDSLPTIQGSHTEPARQLYSAATLEEVEHAAQKVGLPGEVELLDAWSLYYRGRYADSIRSLVTAIEVLLEARLREKLRERGTAPDAAEKLVHESRNSFEKRLSLYCDLSGSRVPGPWLSWVPYINGVRLSREIEQTRLLRHDIVHAGRRLDHSLLRPMRRATEATTWFFDWLSEGGDFAQRQRRHYSFFEAIRNNPILGTRITPEGVRVLPLPDFDSQAGRDDALIVTSLEPADIPEALFLGALGRDGAEGRDIDHFTLMAFARLDRMLTDSPPPPAVPLPYFDRFRIARERHLALVFIVDTHETVTERTVEQIAAAVAIRTREGLEVSAALCVVNDQNGVPWVLREASSIAEQCASLAVACGISLVKTEDLARLATGVRTQGWSVDVAMEALLKPGWVGREPPGAIYLGRVLHFYDRIGVASIELTGEMKVEVGDILVYRLRDRYHQETIASIQQNHTDVTVAQHGRIGVPISLLRAQLPMGALVYRMPKTPQARREDAADMQRHPDQIPPDAPESQAPADARG
jgi:hypothetical protein